MGNVALGAIQGMQGLEKLKAMKLENQQSASQNTALQGLIGTLWQDPKAMQPIDQLHSIPSSGPDDPGFTPSAPTPQTSRIPVPAFGDNPGVPGNFAPQDLQAAQQAFADNRTGLLARAFPKEVGSSMATMMFAPPTPHDLAPGASLVFTNRSGNQVGNTISALPQMTDFMKEMDAAGVKPGTPQFASAFASKFKKDTYVPDLDPLNRGLKTAQTGEANATIAKDTAQTDLLKNGGLSDDTLDRMSEQVLAGQPLNQVAGALGRGSQGATNLARLQDAVTNKANARGIAGNDLAAITQDFKATGQAMGVAAKRGANVDIANNELDAMIPLVQDASDKVGRVGWKSVNQIMNLAHEQGSDPAYGQLSVAIQGAKTAYSQAMARNGVATDMSRKKADDLIDAAQGPQDLMARLDMLQKETRASKKATTDAQATIRSGITGASSNPSANQAPSSAPAGARSATDTKGNKIYFYGGKWQP